MTPDDGHHQIKPTDAALVVTGNDGDERPSALPLWLRIVLPAAFVVLFCLHALSPVRDLDTFWHIAAGQRLASTWSFNGPDPYSSFTTGTWTLHEWLPELVMGWLYAAFGYPGVAWLLPVGVAGVVAAVWSACRARSSMLVATLVTVVACVGMSASLSLRPQLVTFALTAVTVSAWLRTTTDQRVRWWLVPLTWLWACCHGMWFIGPVIGLVAILGLTLERGRSSRELGRLCLVPLLSLAAAALTPVGPALLLAPVKVGAIVGVITEFQPSTIREPQLDALLVLVAVAVVVWARHVQRAPWVELLLLGLGVGLGLLFGRTIAVGTAVVAPLTAGALQQVVPLTREPLHRLERRTLGLAVAVVAAVAAPLSAATAQAPTGVPNGLSPALHLLHPRTVVCNEWTLGGWLILEHPEVDPVIDSRAEIYSTDHISSYGRFILGQPGWHDLVASSDRRVALVSADSPAIERLTTAGWTTTQTADGYSLLTAP